MEKNYIVQMIDFQNNCVCCWILRTGPDVVIPSINFIIYLFLAYGGGGFTALKVNINTYINTNLFFTLFCMRCAYILKMRHIFLEHQ